jgi:alpha-tubulin suppressor-like RCC1 family protein
MQLGVSNDSANFFFAPQHADQWDGLVRKPSCPASFDAILQNITSFALGQHHVIALSNSGKVYSIGRGDYGRLGHGDSAELSEYVVSVRIYLEICMYVCACVSVSLLSITMG